MNAPKLFANISHSKGSSLTLGHSCGEYIALTLSDNTIQVYHISSKICTNLYKIPKDLLVTCPAIVCTSTDSHSEEVDFDGIVLVGCGNRVLGWTSQSEPDLVFELDAPIVELKALKDSKVGIAVDSKGSIYRIDTALEKLFTNELKVEKCFIQNFQVVLLTDSQVLFYQLNDQNMMEHVKTVSNSSNVVGVDFVSHSLLRKSDFMTNYFKIIDSDHVALFHDNFLEIKELKYGTCQLRVEIPEKPIISTEISAVDTVDWGTCLILALKTKEFTEIYSIQYKLSRPNLLSVLFKDAQQTKPTESSKLLKAIKDCKSLNKLEKLVLDHVSSSNSSELPFVEFPVFILHEIIEKIMQSSETCPEALVLYLLKHNLIVETSRFIGWLVEQKEFKILFRMFKSSKSIVEKDLILGLETIFNMETLDQVTNLKISKSIDWSLHPNLSQEKFSWLCCIFCQNYTYHFMVKQLKRLSFSAVEQILDYCLVMMSSSDLSDLGIDILSLVMDAQLANIMLSPTTKPKIELFQQTLKGLNNEISLMDSKLRGCLIPFVEQQSKSEKYKSRPRWNRMVKQVTDFSGSYLIEVFDY